MTPKQEFLRPGRPFGYGYAVPFTPLHVKCRSHARSVRQDDGEVVSGRFPGRFESGDFPPRYELAQNVSDHLMALGQR
jgi:hypothetical protein